MYYFSSSNRPLNNQPNCPPQVFLDLYDQLKDYGSAPDDRTLELTGVYFTLYPEDRSAIQQFNTLKMLRDEIPNKQARAFKRWSNNELRSHIRALFDGAPIADFGGQPGDDSYFRANEQVANIVAALKADPDTRRAVIVLGPTSCITSVQFILRNNRLNLHLNLRSSHLTKGLAADVLFFEHYFLNAAATALRVVPFAMHFGIGSLHITGRF